MRKGKGYKITAFLLTALLAFNSIQMPTHAEEYHTELKDNIMAATQMIETVFEKQYEEAEKKVKETILEKNYDYAMTMETFYDNGNPFQNVDYLELISIYAAIKEYCNQTGKGTGVGLAGCDYLTIQYKDMEMEESIPVLTESYEETEVKGIYKRAGNEVINKATTVGEYTLLDETEGTYILTGEKQVHPKKKTTYYGNVTVTYVGNEYLYEYFGVTEDEIENIREKKEPLFRGEVTETVLQQSVFVALPQDITLPDEVATIIENVMQSGEAYQKTLLTTAISLLGKVPYQWGGKASHEGYNTDWWLFDTDGQQKGLDCSGFVQWVYMTAGYDKEITDKMTSTNEIMGFEDTTYEELEPGDIGLLNLGETTNHTGIYIGDGYFIHCSSSAKTVIISQFPFKFFKKIEKNYENALHNAEKGFNKYSEGVKISDFESESAADTEIPYPETVEDDLEPEVKETEGNVVTQPSQEDILLLAQLIVNEAGGQGYNGKVAVGEVVINRMKAYTQNMREVIYAPNQFSNNERLVSITPDEESLSIAKMLLEGTISILNNENVLFFRNPMITSGIEPQDSVNWGEHTWFTSINDHAFYTK